MWVTASDVQQDVHLALQHIRPNIHLRLDEKLPLPWHVLDKQPLALFPYAPKTGLL